MAADIVNSSQPGILETSHMNKPTADKIFNRIIDIYVDRLQVASSVIAEVNRLQLSLDNLNNKLDEMIKDE